MYFYGSMDKIILDRNMNDSTKINDILKNLLFSDIGQFLFNYK